MSVKQEFMKMDPYSLDMKPFEKIGKGWMLITAGTIDSWNTMTASWGMIGELWGKPAATVFVRPQRHTYGFMEKNEAFCLSFLPASMRKALDVCGTTSGRDTDKAAAAGLTPFEPYPGCVAFDEAELIIACRKAYSADILPERFHDKEIIKAVYPQSDFHRMYVGIVTACLKR
jgi:flavin reductase (DIM6/NTAB) family NADH-FMN oxidoreductase RutF